MTTIEFRLFSDFKQYAHQLCDKGVDTRWVKLMILNGSNQAYVSEVYMHSIDTGTLLKYVPDRTELTWTEGNPTTDNWFVSATIYDYGGVPGSNPMYNAVLNRPWIISGI